MSVTLLVPAGIKISVHALVTVNIQTDKALLVVCTLISIFQLKIKS